MSLFFRLPDLLICILNMRFQMNTDIIILFSTTYAIFAFYSIARLFLVEWILEKFWNFEKMEIESMEGWPAIRMRGWFVSKPQIPVHINGML